MILSDLANVPAVPPLGDDLAALRAARIACVHRREALFADARARVELDAPHFTFVVGLR